MMKAEGRGGIFGAINALLREKSVNLIRPPYAIEGETFESCHTCGGMCITACEENIIRRDEAGKIYLDFQKNGCSDCQQCMEVCTPDVLSEPTRFIQGYAKIKMQSCMSHHDTICFACKEPCLDNAIIFKGMFNPIVLQEKCTGCGYCIGICPSSAIEMIAL